MNSSKIQWLLNVGLRVVLNLVFFGLYPTFLILIHLEREGIFSYDLFVAGSFGIQVFFVLSFLFSAGIAFIFGAPFGYGLWLIGNLRREKKSWVDIAYSSIAVTLFGFVMVLLFLKGFWIKIFFITPVLCLVFLTYMVFRLSFRKYLPLSVTIYAILFTIPLLRNDYTSVYVSVGLEKFGVGGNSKTTVVLIEKELSIEGKMILLSPTTLFLRVDDEIHIIERSKTSRIVLNTEVEPAAGTDSAR